MFSTCVCITNKIHQAVYQYLNSSVYTESISESIHGIYRENKLKYLSRVVQSLIIVLNQV